MILISAQPSRPALWRGAAAHWRSHSVAFLAALFFASSALLAGCVKPKPMVPGETAFGVRSVSFQGAELVDPSVLIGKARLTVRASPPPGLIPGQPYNKFRLLEDQNRLEAFWKNAGFFEVVVHDAEVTFDEEAMLVDVVWTIEEGEPYTIASVDLREAPAGYEDDLRARIPFDVGDRIDMENFRRARHVMNHFLREEGYGHATTFSRAFIDRAKREVHWVYYVDEGPKTKVGTIEVIGDVKIPRETIIERTGLEVGDPLSAPELRKAEIDLVDTGAFVIIRTESDADIEGLIIPLPPDPGGVITAAQVDAKGNLVPRDLPADLTARLVVVDAPAVQTRVGAGGQADISRLDATANASLILRNALGPLHHLSFEGMVGYGHLWRGDADAPLGVYGSALARYTKPGFLLRLLDFRLSAAFEDQLYPDFHTRELSGGPGFRTNFGEKLFWDFDALYRYGETSEFGPFSNEAVDALALDDGGPWGNTEFATSLIWDRRDSGVEALQGTFMAGSLAFAPGGGLGDHSYTKLTGDLRAFIPLNKGASSCKYIEPYCPAFAVGLRGFGGWLVGVGESGAPPAARFFGGGPYGMRGFGLQQMSASAPLCDADGNCEGINVGGRSTAVGSAELRWLPFREVWGVVAFVDAGGVGDEANPFAQGVNVATGLGVRLRIWYVPIDIDLSYRVVDDERSENLDHFNFFFRVGEAF